MLDVDLDKIYSATLLNSKQAAKRLGICERTLWSLRKTGEIPAVLIGRAVRFDPRDLLRWIDRKKGAVADGQYF